MVKSKLDAVVSKVNPEFMELCEVLVVKSEDRYWITQNNAWINVNRDVILSDMDSRRRRMVLVNDTGAVLDTNMELCIECGVPVLAGTYCEECMDGR